MHTEPLSFQVIVTRDAEGAFARASGRLVLGHATKAGTWRRAMALANRRVLTLDLCAVTQIDAAGLGALVRLHRRLRADGGFVRLIAANHRVRRVLALTRVDTLLGAADLWPGGIALPCEMPPSYFRRRLATIPAVPTPSSACVQGWGR